jgi:hypothetical protein
LAPHNRGAGAFLSGRRLFVLKDALRGIDGDCPLAELEMGEIVS